MKAEVICIYNLFPRSVNAPGDTYTNELDLGCFNACFIAKPITKGSDKLRNFVCFRMRKRYGRFSNDVKLIINHSESNIGSSDIKSNPIHIYHRHFRI